VNQQKISTIEQRTESAIPSPTQKITFYTALTGTTYLPLSHDGDSISKYIGLVHEMSGKEDRALPPVLLDHIPDGAASGGVHSCRWFVQNYALEEEKEQ